MSFNLASGPKSQFLAWTAVAGVGLAAYITVKKRTNEKKRVDMQKKLAAQAEAGPSTPTPYRGGVGISTASGAYQAAMQNKQGSTSTSAEAHFLPNLSSSSSSSSQSTLPFRMNELGFGTLADYRKTDPPMSLREYREKMALMDRNME